MRAGRRRAGADDNRARIAIRPPERVAPVRREARTGRLVDRVVEIFRPVAGRFNDDDASARGVENRGEVIGPPLDSDVAALIGARRETEARAGRCISRRMMSPARKRDAAWLIAAAEPMLWEQALHIASAEMPTTPTEFTSPLNSPSTAVPWLRQSTPASMVPATTPPGSA